MKVLNECKLHNVVHSKHNDYIGFFKFKLKVNLPIATLKNILKILMIEILVLSQSLKHLGCFFLLL